MEQVKLLSTTVLLTLLIWVGADQLLTVTAIVDVALSVAPASAESTMIVDVAGPSPALVKVHVSGPRRVVAEVEDVDAIHVTLPVDERATSERATLGNLAELLQNQPRSLKNLTIEAVEPPTLGIVVDQRTTQRVALAVRQPLQLTYDVPPKLDPSYIVVKMSLLRFRRMGDQARQIEIDVESNLKGKPRDEPLSIKLPIPITRFGDGAEASPDTVQVVATLSAAQQRRMTVPTVPIRLAPGFAAFDRPIRAELPGGSAFVTRTIEVTGDDDALDRLDLDNTGIYGVIPLTESDYERLGQLLVKMPDFILPPGIELYRDPEPVQFQLMAVESDVGVDRP